MERPFDINKVFNQEEIEKTFGSALPRLKDAGRPSLSEEYASSLPSAVERVRDEADEWECESDEESTLRDWREILGRDKVFQLQHPLTDERFPIEVEKFLDWAFQHRENLRDQLYSYSGGPLSGHDISRVLEAKNDHNRET